MTVRRLGNEKCATRCLRRSKCAAHCARRTKAHVAMSSISRKGMFRSSFTMLGLTVLLATACLSGKASESGLALARLEASANKPEVLESDGRFRVEFGEERVVAPRG